MTVPRFSRSHVLVALIVVVASWVLPAAAREVVDYARNAGKVDGFSAVPSGSNDRGGKLVATRENGRLPNDIIKRAPRAFQADYLRQFGPSAFVLGCQDGAIRGQAHVRPTIGSEFEEVTGFGTLHGGPVNEGNSCHARDAMARKVGVGIYDVNLATIAWDCDQPLQPDVITALVSVETSEPLVSSYVPVCDEGTVYVRVHIYDLTGETQDAPFTVALLASQGIPIP